MDKIYFTINGEHYTLSGSEVSSDTSLNDYLRNYLGLHGTKAMCHEGGCGACVVAVTQTHPTKKEKHVFSVNSCLVHVLSCHQWDITTVEGVGNRKDGYHEIQSRLAAFNGTQCGYCTPGWIMNMYSIYKSSNMKLTMREIEGSFAGNMCRCTGYRPILDAFKSFATDASEELKTKIQDLEDLHKMKCLKKCEKRCSAVVEDWCVIENDGASLLEVNVGGGKWYKAYTVNDIFKILSKFGTENYRLVAGNTGTGIYPPVPDPRVLIDISSVESLKDAVLDENLILGAGMTLADVMRTFEKYSTDTNFSYLDEFHKHLDLVATVPVRNIGTIGGNLAMKNKHREFPSDVFVLLCTVHATVTIMSSNEDKKELKMADFLTTDLTNKLILNVKLPPLSSRIFLRTYKIMPRAQNALAIVNAGFLFKMDASNKVVKSNIVYGTVGPKFVSATETEAALQGRELFSDETLKMALVKLAGEIVPVEVPPEPSPWCRKTLALGLLYKALLSLNPAVNPRYKSGGMMFDRPISHGVQSYDTDKSLWPLNQPVTKLEALTQCSGEVKYSCDTVSEPREVHVALVLSKVCGGDIDRFDAGDALKLPGVVAFLTSKDIPGKNSFTPTQVPWQIFDEEILASKRVLYYGQPVGLVAAVTHKLARKAAELVKVYYKNVKSTPVLSIKDALAAPDKDDRIRQDASVKRKDKGTDIKHVIKGSFSVGSQYHYTMETQCCTVSNTENGVLVQSATQWLDLVHVAIAGMLGIDENKVEVVVARVGGGYGGKASRSALAACACALAARVLARRAALVLPLPGNMAAIGKRQPCDAHYEVGVNDDGVIQYLDITYYSDCGCSYNDSSGGSIASTLTTMYASERWEITGYSVLTDKAANTWCRAPGTTEGIAITEHIMERIAYTINRDPIDVRLKNISPENNIMKDIIATFKTDTKYEDRRTEIAKYNNENAWKKRSLKLSIMSFPIEYSGNFAVTISVYHADGTVAISHGGVEMGQGINTKVAQVCAFSLKVPLDKVTVKVTNNFVSPNSMASNGSITSDSVAYATVKACEVLLGRLETAKSELNEPTWEEVVKLAYEKGINLQASYMTSQLDSLVDYSVYGVCAAEVELDVLTGRHQVLRVHLLEDTGVSMSPEIDVGQIEGAFIMGLGMWTSEQLIYENTGRLLTDNTWWYHPPGALDIPVEFTVSFRRKSINNGGVLRSKATGEPALTLAVVVALALHDAILEARKEFGYKNEWVQVGVPYNVENMLKAISPKIEYFKFK